MSTRVHTTNAAYVGTQLTDPELLVETFGDGYDVNGIEVALMFEDGANQEAFVIVAETQDELCDFCLRAYDATCDLRWDNSYVQFARLLAEIVATQDSIDDRALAESMDLSVERVNELFSRAQSEWERAKEGIV